MQVNDCVGLTPVVSFGVWGRAASAPPIARAGTAVDQPAAAISGRNQDGPLVLVRPPRTSRFGFSGVCPCHVGGGRGPGTNRGHLFTCSVFRGRNSAFGSIVQRVRRPYRGATSSAARGPRAMQQGHDDNFTGAPVATVSREVPRLAGVGRPRHTEMKQRRGRRPSS